MDLIGSITQQLGLPQGAAEGLAGSLLGAVQGQVREQSGEEAAAGIDGAIPELGGWKAAAAAFTGGGSAPAAGGLGGMLGGLGGGAGGLGGMLGGLGGAASALGGGAGGFDLASIAGLVSKFGVGGDQVTQLLPLVATFLQGRLGGAQGGLLQTVMGAVPLLRQFLGQGSGAAPAAPSAANLLGGLFGK